MIKVAIAIAVGYMLYRVFFRKKERFEYTQPSAMEGTNTRTETVFVTKDSKIEHFENNTETSAYDDSK